MKLLCARGHSRHRRTWQAIVCSVLAFAAPVRPLWAEREAVSDDAVTPAPEVVVHGEPRHPGAPPKDPAVAGSIVRRERLVAPGVRAADVLRRESGVQITEAGGLGAPATASLRGATAAQTPVFVGEVRVNDDVAGTADLGTIPLFLIDRVEIYRGNAPIEADRLGIGGAIFFEPRRPEDAGSGFGALAGSFGTRAGWAYAAASAVDASLLVGVRGEAAENDYEFFDDRGTLFVPSDGGTRRRTNADASVLDVWVIGRNRVERAEFKLIANHVAREQGAPKLASVPSLLGRAELERSLGAVEARVPLDGAGSSLSAQTSVLAARSVLDDPLFELALGAGLVESRGERVAQRLALRWAAADGLVLRPAFDVAFERLRRFDGDSPDRRRAPVLAARRVSARAALAGEFHVSGPLSLRPLVALECHRTRANDETSACESPEPNGRFAALLDFGQLNVYASAGRYARAPTLGELYGMSLAVHGNASLEAESGHTVESGVRIVGRQGSALRPPWIDVAVFSRWAKNLVSFVRSAQGFVVPQNRAAARVRGVELDCGAGFLRYFAARLTLTALDPRDTTADRATRNDVLPFQSRLVVAPGVEAQTTLASRLVRRLSAFMGLFYESSRFGDAAGLGVIPAQSSLDVEMAAAGLDEHVTVRARVANALDSRRFDVVGFPLPGRSAFLSMEATW